MKNLSRYIMAGACFILAVGMTVMVVQMLYWSISSGSIGKSIGAIVWALIAFPAVAYISMRGRRALRGEEVLTRFELDSQKKEPISEGAVSPKLETGPGLNKPHEKR